MNHDNGKITVTVSVRQGVGPHEGRTPCAASGRWARALIAHSTLDAYRPAGPLTLLALLLLSLIALGRATCRPASASGVLLAAARRHDPVECARGVMGASALAGGRRSSSSACLRRPRARGPRWALWPPC